MRIWIILLALVAGSATATGPYATQVETMRQIAQQIPGTAPDAQIDTVITTDTLGKDGHAYGSANYSTGLIRLTPEANDYTVIHEIAHVLTPDDWHGETWCSLYLAGINEMLTPSEYNATHCPHIDYQP